MSLWYVAAIDIMHVYEENIHHTLRICLLHLCGIQHVQYMCLCIITLHTGDAAWQETNFMFSSTIQ